MSADIKQRIAEWIEREIAGYDFDLLEVTLSINRHGGKWVTNPNDPELRREGVCRITNSTYGFFRP